MSRDLQLPRLSFRYSLKNFQNCGPSEGLRSSGINSMGVNRINSRSARPSCGNLIVSAYLYRIRHIGNVHNGIVLDFILFIYEIYVSKVATKINSITNTLSSHREKYLQLNYRGNSIFNYVTLYDTLDHVFESSCRHFRTRKVGICDRNRVNRIDYRIG